MVINKLKKHIKVIISDVENYFLKLFGYTYKGQRHKPIVFVLSTGRCGSTSIKSVFNQHSRFKAFHEDITPLIKLSTRLFEKPEDEKAVFSELDMIFANRIWEGKREQIIVHSDHRLWNLVPYLNKYFTNAFFIHLIRNPKDSVKSYIQRDWYLDTTISTSDSVFDKYRLQGNRSHDMTDASWNELNQIEKCLWYWSFVNSRIYNDLHHLDKTLWDVIRLENFIEDLNRVIKLKFKMESHFFFEDIISNRSKKELESDEVLDRIDKTIELHRNTLFLNYYSNEDQT